MLDQYNVGINYVNTFLCVILNSHIEFCNVLQATTLVDFPAPMSMCAITSLIGVVITATVQLIQNHKVDFGWPLVKLGDLICYSVLVISHRSLSFNIDCMYRFFAHFSHN